VYDYLPPAPTTVQGLASAQPLGLVEILSRLKGNEMKIAQMNVDLVDHMGTDLSVVNAARVSFDKASEWDFNPAATGNVLSERDTKLINYLAKHNHWTPMAHPQVTLRIKAPIFVARQWFKHMVGITRNETSRRYVDSEPEFYFPEQWRGRPTGSVKQGSSGVHPASGAWAFAAGANVGQLLNLYNEMIEDGVAPEQARMILPQNMMTEWIETASLAAVCRSCKLRLDPHAQQETREIAERIAEIVAPLFPVSWSALMEVEK
jgi:thymidylate synthase (FAD)